MTTQFDELITALKGVGLSKNEAAVYLANLELGPCSIWDLSKKSGIKRPTCYVILDDLILRGYASSTNDGKRTIYSVVSPKQLLRTAERRYESLQASITQLDALASKSPSKPIVRHYEGIQGVIEAYNLSLDQPKGGEILIYGTAEFKVSYGDFIPKYIENRTKKNLSVRAILPENAYNREILDTDEKYLRQTRFFPVDKFGQQTEINIFLDTIVYIAHSETEPFATVIENATLAQEEKQRFNLLWELAKHENMEK